MTAFALGLLVMSAIVAGVFLFGAFWLKRERRQAEERSRKAFPWYLEGQEEFTFTIPKRGFGTMAGRGQ